MYSYNQDVYYRRFTYFIHLTSLYSFSLLPHSVLPPLSSSSQWASLWQNPTKGATWTITLPFPGLCFYHSVHLVSSPVAATEQLCLPSGCGGNGCQLLRCFWVSHQTLPLSLGSWSKESDRAEGTVNLWPLWLSPVQCRTLKLVTGWPRLYPGYRASGSAVVYLYDTLTGKLCFLQSSPLLRTARG